MAHFEIYILNYNGVQFLPNCLNSLRQMDRGQNTVVVNVVDNGSTDGSCDLVQSSYPEINFISLKSNLGFSRGNNAGVEIRKRALALEGRKANFHVFLNNDTAVGPDWLMRAADAFEEDQKIGIVGSKSLFFDHFIVLHIKNSLPFRASVHGGQNDSQQLCIRLNETVQGENINILPQRKKYLGASSLQGSHRLLSANATVFIPVLDPTLASRAVIKLENPNSGGEPQCVTIRLEGGDLIPLQHVIPPGAIQEISIAVKSSELRSVIQNAGSFVKKSWEAGDIGFLEIDRGQYETLRDSAAICGVSLFIRSETFDELGGFDKNSFAYYEDTDLSVRARLRGWRCVYAPKSVLRHVHCGSGVEHSEYFNTNVTYSRLLFASKMLPGKAWRELRRAYWVRFSHELEAYEVDHQIENKPYLRAMGRYIKHPLVFLKNRMYAFLQKPSERFSNLLID